ncbi:MAG: hypothetical protein WCG02_03110 [Candidatus Taylorbacteria bacterium]
MTPEEKSLLERTYKLAEDNNAILRSIRRSNRVSTILRILYWVVILGSGFAAYYFIQPYLAVVTGLYSQAQGGINTLQGGVTSVQDAANSIRELLK